MSRSYPDPAMQSLLTAARRYSNSTNGNDTAASAAANGNSRTIPIHRQEDVPIWTRAYAVHT
jgi:hypothetical protein